MRVPKHGRGKLRIGGKNPPGTGRPPDAWRELCRELSSRAEMIQTAEAVLKESKHPAWLGAWKFLGEQGYGKAAQTVQLAGNVTIVIEGGGLGVKKGT